MGDFDRARAKGLLDLYGYVDRDGDGWRELPDGRPLQLEMATQPDSQSRAQIEQWQKNMTAVGLRHGVQDAEVAREPQAEHRWQADDVERGLARLCARRRGSSSRSATARARARATSRASTLTAFNTLYDRQKTLPDGPERQQAIDAAQRLMVAYMPVKGRVHRIATDLAHPWVVGYHRKHLRARRLALRRHRHRAAAQEPAMNPLRGLLLALALLALPPAQAAEPKVLRYAFGVAETTFDPARTDDLYSRIVSSHIFEALVDYDYLARPYKLVPGTAAALPEPRRRLHGLDGAREARHPLRRRPGLQGREARTRRARLRLFVPAPLRPGHKSPVVAGYTVEGVLGVAALREEALATKKPFDYDREVEGLRVLDRYTLQFRLAKPRPHFLQTIADASLLGAVAREVIETYGDKAGEHPVGTGPFRLTQWRRSSLMVLERNPGYRERVFDAQPAADDAEGQAIAQRFKGRRLPMVDRVEIAVIEESQPRWLSFVGGEFDLLWGVPLEFTPLRRAGRQARAEPRARAWRRRRRMVNS